MEVLIEKCTSWLHNILFTESRKEMQLERHDANKQSTTRKIGQDLWRQLYQFQCLMEITEIVRSGSQPSMHVWIRLQQLQNKVWWAEVERDAAYGWTGEFQTNMCWSSWRCWKICWFVGYSHDYKMEELGNVTIFENCWRKYLKR